jgi:hypothetical protein
MSEAATMSTSGHAALDCRYSLYSQAMRLLIREGQTLQQLQRSICWARLMSLHQILPALYCDPVQLYINFKQEIYA